MLNFISLHGLYENLLSEFIGIIVSFAFVPVIIKVIHDKNSRNQRILSHARLIDFTDKYLEKLLPKDNYVSEFQEFKKIISSNFITTNIKITKSDDISTNLHNLLHIKSSEKNLSEYIQINEKVMANMSEEISEILILNANYIPTNVFEELHKLLYSLRINTQIIDYKQQDFKNLYYEYLLFTVNTLLYIRIKILDKYPKVSKKKVNIFFGK
jgi:hypothetical protein